MRVLVWVFLAGLVAVGACADTATTPSQQARVIERQIWSPYCPGRLLADCTTRQASELRHEIEARLGRGQTPQQVLNWLRSNYGDEVLAQPAAGVRGLAIWLVPAVVVLAGAAGVTLLVRRWVRAAPAGQEPELVDDAYRRRLREEVEREG